MPAFVGFAAAEISACSMPRRAFLNVCGCAGSGLPGCQPNAYSVRASRPINRLPAVPEDQASEQIDPRNEGWPTMYNSLPAVSVSAGPPVNQGVESKQFVEDEQVPPASCEGRRIARFRARQSGKLHSRFASYMAFGAAVFISMMAAVTVASHDVPLMLGGF